VIKKIATKFLAKHITNLMSEIYLCSHLRGFWFNSCLLRWNSGSDLARNASQTAVFGAGEGP